MLLKKLYRLALASDVFWGFGEGLYGPLYAIFVAGLGGSFIEIGVAYSILLILQGALMDPFGKLADRYGRKPFAVMAGILFAVAALLYAFWVKDVVAVFVTQVIIGISTAMVIPSWEMIMFQVSGKKHTTQRFGILEGSIYVGEGVAGIIGSAIASFVSFQALFVGVSVLMFVSTAFVAFMKIR